MSYGGLSRKIQFPVHLTLIRSSIQEEPHRHMPTHAYVELRTSDTCDINFTRGIEIVYGRRRYVHTFVVEAAVVVLSRLLYRLLSL